MGFRAIVQTPIVAGSCAVRLEVAVYGSYLVGGGVGMRGLRFTGARNSLESFPNKNLKPQSGRFSLPGDPKTYGFRGCTKK